MSPRHDADDLEACERHLAALRGEADLPGAAVAWCASHLGEVAPALREVLAKAADGSPLEDDEARLLLRGLFILGGRRDAETFPVLLRFLRRPAEDLEHLLGETLEVGLPKILSGTFDGDAPALFALATDPSCLDAVRCSAMEASAFLAFDRRLARDAMQAFLSDFAESKTAKGDLVWIMWTNAIAKLGFRDLGPLVEAALADGRISKALMRKRHFDNELAAAEASPDDASRFDDACYIDDIVAALDGRAADEASAVAATDMRIELHLAALGTELKLPDAALKACVARVEEAAPALQALLDRAARGRRLSEDDALRLFRGLYVLAAVRDTTACASLLRLLRRPAEETEELLGDAITASLPRLLISLYDGDDEALLAVITDGALDEFLRGSALDAAIFLTWEGRIGRERLVQFLNDFYDNRRAKAGEYVWYSWMMAVALLDLGDLVPKVEAAWKAKWVDHSILEWDDFKMDLARARTAWDDVGRFDRARLGYADDVIAELEWTRHWGDEEAAKAEAARMQPMPDTTVVNPYRGVGRNDPCPCGSGKKYKKCCLATG